MCYGPYGKAENNENVPDKIYIELREVLDVLRECEYLDGKKSYLNTLEREVDEVLKLIQRIEKITEIRKIDKRIYTRFLSLCSNITSELVSELPSDGARRSEWLEYYRRFIEEFDHLRVIIQQTYYKALYRRL